MGDYESPAAIRYADRDVAILISGMIRVENSDAERISQNSGGFHKADAMLLPVDLSFLGVPFELDHNSPIRALPVHEFSIPESTCLVKTGIEGMKTDGPSRPEATAGHPGTFSVARCSYLDGRRWA